MQGIPFFILLPDQGNSVGYCNILGHFQVGSCRFRSLIEGLGAL